MNYLLKREAIERLKKQYPKGIRVELVIMHDAYPVPPGTKGTVAGIDDIGTIHVKWDNGRIMGCIPGVDEIHSIYDF